MIKYFVIFIYLFILFIYFLFFKQKDNFKNSNENIKDITKINKYIIIGKGNEIHKYINVFKQLKKKNKYKFIAFHQSFFFFKEKLDFYPDYYIVGDPNGSIETIEYINSNNLDIIVIIPKFLTKEKHSFIIGSQIWRNSKKWDKWITNIRLLKKKIIIDSKINRYSNHNDLITCLKKKEENYCYPNVNWNSNKFGEIEQFTSTIIYVCYYLKFSEVYIVGFDCIFDSKIREKKIKKFLNNYTKLYLEKYKCNIFNLTPDSNTNLKGIVKYYNINNL